MEELPRASDLEERWSTILHYRQHMRKIGDLYDVSHPENSIDPGRTVDGPTLTLLKSPQYPFSLCEEAPASYIPPPVPFDVNEELSRLEELIHEVQVELDAHRDYLKDAKAQGTVDGLLHSDVVLTFLNDSIAYMDLAWGISSLKWFHHWVLSHSISGLLNATEQLEYVLTDYGQSLPQSVEMIEENMRRCPFPMAVGRLENDRKLVIQLERARLNSKSRTYRDGVSSRVLTATASPYLNVEEKYMYQEVYNETEYCMQAHNLAKMKDRASRGSSTVHSSTMSGRHTALVKTSYSFVEPEISTVVDEAHQALDREEEMLKKLIDTIGDRKARNIRFDKSELEKEASRMAQITVYGCVLSDEQLMSGQLDAVLSFLTDYQNWIDSFNFESHDALMEKLREFSGEKGRWPAAQPTSYYATYQKRFQQQRNLVSNFQGGGYVSSVGLQSSPGKSLKEDSVSRSAANTSTASGSHMERDAGAQSTSAILGSTGTSIREDGLVDSFEEQYANGRRRGGDDGSTSSQALFSQSFFSLLEGICQHGKEGDRNFSSDSFCRKWMIFAVRLATQNFYLKSWDPLLFLRQKDTSEDTLYQLVRSSSSERITAFSSSVAVVFKVIQCLCQALLQNPSATSMYEVAYITVPPTSTYDPSKKSISASDLSSVELAQWGALLDVLWFQADPTGQANGGLFLGTEQSVLPIVHFLKLSAASFSNAILQLFYKVDETQGRGATVYTVREVAEKPLSFVRSPQDRSQFAIQLFLALQKVENAGILSFYACRLEEIYPVELVDVIFVYCHAEAGRQCWDRFGLLPPAAVALKRIEVGKNSSPPFSSHCYEVPAPFSSVVLQMGDILTFLGTVPNPVLSLIYFYGETLREQAFWEIENSVVPHAFIGCSSYPTNMSEVSIKSSRGNQLEFASGDEKPAAAFSASSHRQLAGVIIRQLQEIVKTEGN